MNNRLYSHLYLHLKNIFTFKKCSILANLPIEKPGKWCALAKMWKKKKRPHLKKEILRERKTITEKPWQNMLYEKTIPS